MTSVSEQSAPTQRVRIHAAFRRYPAGIRREHAVAARARPEHLQLAGEPGNPEDNGASALLPFILLRRVLLFQWKVSHTVARILDDDQRAVFKLV